MRAIEATQHHELTQTTPAAKADLIRADLWDLGADWETYERNSELVKAEYRTTYSADEWTAGRKKFLDSFLTRASIYNHPDLQGRELRAHRNMYRELRSL